MKNFITTINHTADAFENALHKHSTNLKLIPTEDFGWINTRYRSDQFRLAHIERFNQPNFSVLHMVVFPHLTDAAPIFGFDIIASETKATGLFFDLSPTVDNWGKFCDTDVSQSRDRPEWGDIFSDHWVACKPTLEEFERVAESAAGTLALYLTRLGEPTEHDVAQITQAQNRYSLGQRKNEHTSRVLMKILGPDRGRYFLESVLFPTTDSSEIT
jgi:phycocyanobilin:ferredoxin oxidoreductase